MTDRRPDDGRAHEAGDPFWLEPLPIPEGAKIDGLRLLEGPSGPTLLYSIQTCQSPRRGFGDCQMEIKAVSVNEPARATLIASLQRPLPPPPRWDATAAEGEGFEILFEEAGGALYRLLLRDPSGALASPTAAHPLQSFSQPRFLRGGSAVRARAASATLADKSLVVFPDVRSSPPAGYTTLAGSPDGVAGWAGELWVVTKTTVSGIAAFNELPGRLSLLRLSKLDAAALTSTTPFPGFLAYEFDAAPLGTGTDVVVFATGKASALLLASCPSRPIALAASERRWLSNLSRPTLSVGAGRLRMAAIANPGTEQVRILYGDFLLAALNRL